MTQKEFTDRLTAYMMSNRQQLFCYACYRVGCAEDAEDIMQSVYLHMLEHFDPDKPVDNMAAYVYRSLANSCSSHCDAQRFVSLDSSEEMEDLCETPSDNFDDEYNRIDRILSILPEDCREVIRLKLHASLPFDDIAATLGISPSAAKRRYYYGLETLRSKLKIR